MLLTDLSEVKRMMGTDPSDTSADLQITFLISPRITAEVKYLIGSED